MEIQELERDNRSIRPICRADFIEPVDLLLKINGPDDYLVLDARSKTDYSRYKIDCQCVNIPPEDIEKKMSNILLERLHDVDIDKYLYSLLINWDKCGLIILMDWHSSWERYSRIIAELRNTLMRQEPYNVALPRVMILEGGLSRFIKKFPYIVKKWDIDDSFDGNSSTSFQTNPAKKFKAWSPDRSDSTAGTSFQIPIETEMSVKSEVKFKHDYSDLRSAITGLSNVFEMPSCMRTVLQCIRETPYVEEAFIQLGNLRDIFDWYKREGPHDAPIFLRIFLKSMHCDLITGPDNKSSISDLFFGTMKHSFTCSTCGNSTSKYEEFQTLTVPRNSEVWTRGFGLVDFVSEIMQERCVSGFKCLKCGVPRRAIKRFGFSHLPKNIIFHLDRATSRHGRINLERMDYPFTRLNLRHYMVADAGTLTERLNANCCYNLYAMIRIDGTQYNNNGYVAYCKSPVDQRWTHYEKKRASYVLSKIVKKQKLDNYLLFYRRELRH